MLLFNENMIIIKRNDQLITQTNRKHCKMATKKTEEKTKTVKRFTPVESMLAPTKIKKSGKIKNPQQIVDTMYIYLNWCIDNNMTPTKAGFAVALDFSTPKVVLQWCKRMTTKNFSYEASLARAYGIMEDCLVNVLTDPANKNGNGMFRYMQNGYGYRDKVDSVNDNTSRVIRLPARAKPGTAVNRDKQKKKLSRNKSKTTTGSGKKS